MRFYAFILILAIGQLHFAIAFAIAQDSPTPTPVPIAGTDDVVAPQAIEHKIEFYDAVDLHFDRLINYSLDHYGRTRSGTWASSIDTVTNELAMLDDDSDATGYVPGSMLYWDQPTLLAANELGKRSGCKCYPDSAENYLRSYMHLGGSFRDLLPGDQRFLNAFADQMQSFQEIPDSKMIRAQMIHTPAWEMVWRMDRAAVEQQIVDFAETKNLTSPQKVIAVHSLLWLMQQTNDNALQSKLKQLTRQFQSTSKNCTDAFSASAVLITSSQATGRSEFKEIAVARAADALKLVDLDWASLTFDQVPVRDAESCVTILTGTTKSDDVRQELMDFVKNCANALERNLNVQKEASVTAEHYGRAIHFLDRASTQFQQPSYAKTARSLADDAIANLFDRESNMFRSRIGSSRCDAADGPGWLFLALLALDGDDATKSSALKF